ncbi:MAG: hypothetical protein LBS21_14285 [Clostridiales bacterium]|jgi:ABC-type transport system involved in multi-copper enzyme maturation permease subunit|nr:hypothetical protein [Clostridiales bacterium]
MRIVSNLFVLLLFAAGIVILQIFLSRKENKWLGLILPIISLCISVISVLGVAFYSTVTSQSSTLQTTYGNEEIIWEEIVTDETNPVDDAMERIAVRPAKSIHSLVITIISVFLLYNIPTVILFAIYFAGREKQRRKKALESMKKQDLC